MITLHQVTKHYGLVSALENVSLEIFSGDTVVIQGPSGSGKSTLLRLIAGLETPTRGKIDIAGEEVSSPSHVTPAYKRSLGFVFQRSALWPHMTVMQNILFAMHNTPKIQVVDLLKKILEQMNLEELAYRYPDQLSGGEARRVALARALSSNPSSLLLDEPLTSLDPGLKGHLLDVICNYAIANGTTLLYVTHLPDEAEQVGGRHICMRDGRVVET